MMSWNKPDSRSSVRRHRPIIGQHRADGQYSPPITVQNCIFRPTAQLDADRFVEASLSKCLTEPREPLSFCGHVFSLPGSTGLTNINLIDRYIIFICLSWASPCHLAQFEKRLVKDCLNKISQQAKPRPVIPFTIIINYKVT